LLKWIARAQTAATLLVVFDAERAAGKNAQPQAVLTPSVPAAPAVPAPAVETAKSDRSWLGWTLLGAGVAAGAGSVLAWHKNGELGDCSVTGGSASCRKELHTVVPTVALGVAAVGALVTGTILLVHQHREAGGLTLFLNPTGVALGGSFR
jgi:hypothetical protein